MSARQAAALAAFARLARHPVLRGARPVLAGTFPLGLNVAASDLDVICEVRDPARFADRLARAFGRRPGFRLRLRTMGGLPTVVARFREAGLPVEVFAQAWPARAQRAVRHLRVEAHLLELHGEPLRLCVRAQGPGRQDRARLRLLPGARGRPLPGPAGARARHRCGAAAHSFIATVGAAPSS